MRTNTRNLVLFIDLQNVKHVLGQLQGRYHTAYVFHDEEQIRTIEQHKGRLQWHFERAPKYVAFSLGNKNDQFADRLINSTVLWAHTQFPGHYEFVIVSNDRGFSRFVSDSSEQLGRRKVVCSGVLPEYWGPAGPPAVAPVHENNRRKPAPKQPNAPAGRPKPAPAPQTGYPSVGPTLLEPAPPNHG